MGNEVQKNDNAAPVPKEKLQVMPENIDQSKEFEEKYGDQLKTLIQKFQEKMGHSDEKVRNKAKTGMEKLFSSFLKEMDEPSKQAFFEKVSKLNSKELEALISKLSTENSEKMGNIEILKPYISDITHESAEEIAKAFYDVLKKRPDKVSSFGTDNFKQWIEIIGPKIQGKNLSAEHLKEIISLISKGKLWDEGMEKFHELTLNKLLSLHEIYKKLDPNFDSFRIIAEEFEEMENVFVYSPENAKRLQAKNWVEWLEKMQNYLPKDHREIVEVFNMIAHENKISPTEGWKDLRQASQLFELVRGPKWGLNQYPAISLSLEHIQQYKNYFADPEQAKKFRAPDFLSWLEQNIDFIKKEKLNFRDIESIMRLIRDGKIEGTLSEKTFGGIPLNLLSTLEIAQFPLEYAPRLKNIISDINTDGYKFERSLGFIAFIFQSPFYQELAKDWGDKLLFTFINATCPTVLRGKETAYQAVTFIQDPAFNCILQVSKYAPVSPETDPELCIDAGRTLYFNLGKQEYAGDLKQAAERSFREVKKYREKYGKIKIFENVILFSNNETGNQNSADIKEQSSDVQRFAEEDVVNNMRKSAKERFQNHIAPLEPNYTPSISSTSPEGKSETYDTQRSNFTGSFEKFKAELSNQIITAEHGKTFIFYGHGGPDKFYFSPNQTFSAEEFADILKKRSVENPPNVNEKPDIFMFLSCHSSEFLRKVNESLGETKTHAIFIQTAEYGYFGYADNSGLELRNQDLSKVTLDTTLEAQKKRYEEKSCLLNNPAIYLRLADGGLMQIGKKEDISENSSGAQAT